MKLPAMLALDFERCKIQPEVKSHPFVDWKSLPKSQGLYSIWQEDRCIYVGQGGGKTGIKDRFHHHWNKAHAILQSGTSHGKGWREGRELDWWTPQAWTVEYFECKGAVHRTYLEGAMMLVLDPYCNDESFEDRKSST
jgi:hypothetical protein